MGWLEVVFLGVELWAQGPCKTTPQGRPALSNSNAGRATRSSMVAEGCGGLSGTTEHTSGMQQCWDGLARSCLSWCGALGPRPLQNHPPGQAGLVKFKCWPSNQELHGSRRLWRTEWYHRAHQWNATVLGWVGSKLSFLVWSSGPKALAKPPPRAGRPCQIQMLAKQPGAPW